MAALAAPCCEATQAIAAAADEEEETYGDPPGVTVVVASVTAFRGTLLDASVDRTGLMQWPARVAVSEWLCAAAREARFEGKSLLELGCGAGGCGAVAAKLGLRVDCSDASEEAVALAARNLARNGASSESRAFVHAWGEPLDRAYDIVFAADVVYPNTTPEAASALFASARAATRSTFVLGFVLRGRGFDVARCLFRAAAAAGCSARPLRLEKALPCDPRLFEFEFSREANAAEAADDASSPVFACATAAFPGIWDDTADGGASSSLSSEADAFDWPTDASLFDDDAPAAPT